MNLGRISSSASLALVAALVLSACTNPGEDNTATSVSASAPSPFIAGDVVDVATAEELNSGALPGLRAYGMQDGMFLVVSESEPLPESVLEDMTAYVDAVPIATPESSGDVDSKLSDFVFTARKQTGKKVVVLTSSWYPESVEADAPTVEKWVHVGEAQGVPNPGDDPEPHTREEYRAMLEQAQDEDSDIVIIEHG